MIEQPVVGRWLPWASFNLRRNPFGELSREERIELAVVDVDGIAKLIASPHCCVEFVGDCGRGKTTRMLTLHHRLEDSSYVYFGEDGYCPPVALGNPLMIDEAQRLPRFLKRRIFSTGVPLILATHQSLSATLKRFGYNVTSIGIGPSNDAELVHRIMSRRIEASRLTPGPIPRMSLDDARWLVTRFGDNVRAIEGYLYEKTQSQVNSHGEMRFVD